MLLPARKSLIASGREAAAAEAPRADQPVALESGEVPSDRVVREPEQARQLLDGAGAPPEQGEDLPTAGLKKTPGDADDGHRFLGIGPPIW